MMPASVVPYRVTLMRVPRFSARASSLAKSLRATATGTRAFFMLYKIRLAAQEVNTAMRLGEASCDVLI